MAWSLASHSLCCPFPSFLIVSFFSHTQASCPLWLMGGHLGGWTEEVPLPGCADDWEHGGRVEGSVWRKGVSPGPLGEPGGGGLSLPPRLPALLSAGPVRSSCEPERWAGAGALELFSPGTAQGLQRQPAGRRAWASGEGCPMGTWGLPVSWGRAEHFPGTPSPTEG